ncbi:MAG: cupin domain-containing protein [Clostridiales bacterium]|nr:cupin domain-containing protein [Clostridiales bacterium]
MNIRPAQGDRAGNQPQDHGPEPFVTEIEREAEQNSYFRAALWTGEKLQITLMSLLPEEDIGLEVHPETDQLLQIEEGHGLVQIGDDREHFSLQRRVTDGDIIVIPAGKWHNLTNIGQSPLKLFSVYAPPEHPAGTAYRTKAEEMQDRFSNQMQQQNQAGQPRNQTRQPQSQEQPRMEPLPPQMMPEAPTTPQAPMTQQPPMAQQTPMTQQPPMAQQPQVPMMPQEPAAPTPQVPMTPLEPMPPGAPVPPQAPITQLPPTPLQVPLIPQAPMTPQTPLTQQVPMTPQTPQEPAAPQPPPGFQQLLLPNQVRTPSPMTPPAQFPQITPEIPMTPRPPVRQEAPRTPQPPQPQPQITPPQFNQFAPQSPSSNQFTQAARQTFQPMPLPNRFRQPPRK